MQDAESRENEGDYICAAEFATPENVNLMASDAKGVICMPMDGELADRLFLVRWCSGILTIIIRLSWNPLIMWKPEPAYPLMTVL